MTDLDETKKDEIIKEIEYILEPIGAEVASFGEPHDMYCGIRERYSTESIFSEKNKTTIYPIIIETKLGELRMSIHSDRLYDLRSAIGIAYSYSSFNEKGEVPNDVSLEIQKRIYSRE